MSDALHRTDEIWDPPRTFRDGLADAERIAALLLDQLDVHLVITTAEVEFLARRLHKVVRAAHRALPPEVS